MTHLRWHKPRSTVLRPRIEGLSDDYHSKPQCLFQLSGLSGLLGNDMDQKRLLTRVLELGGRRGNDDRVARTLRELANTNRMLCLCGEGIQQLKEALEIYEQLGDAEGQGKCWNYLGWLLVNDEQLEAAEEAASRSIKLLDQGREYWVCKSHQLLSRIYRSKDERGKAIEHIEAALGIASPFEWHDQLFWIYYSLARLSCAMELQVWIRYQRGQVEEAKAEAHCALETFEKLGVTTGVAWCRGFLREIEPEVEA